MSLHIRPISDLRNKSLEISKLAHKHGTVFITRNGKEDLVVMSVAMWEDLYVYPKLLEAEEAERNGDVGRPFEEVMDDLGKKYGLGKYWKGDTQDKRGKRRRKDS
jgi:prevent-host-death family protein